ncbi:MAG: DoxX family protein [Gammaproteobacteria bacterium]|nr:DoxX family protein [Gammaproteobacteria bacterium]
MDKTLNLVGRILMAQIFLLAGLNKITGYAGTQGYMDAMGVPGMLLPLVIALEIGGGLALLLGWQTRWAGLALAGFSIVSAALFHANFTDQMQTIMFMKNLAMAGGLLMLSAYPVTGTWSLDARRG